MKTKHRLLIQQAEYIQHSIEKIKSEQAQGLYPNLFEFPVGLQFELTSKCGLHCKHCYNASGTSHSKDEMTVADWKHLVTRVIAAGGVFQCIISGGEPLLLGDALFEIMNPLHEDGTGFILITNGLLVTKEIVSKLKKYDFYWVQVSIDDVLSTAHDEFREKTGSWNKAINAAYLISGAGFPLRIAHSVTPDNLNRLTDMIDLAYKLGASSIVCGSVMLSGRAVANKELFSYEDSFLYDFYSIVEQTQCQYGDKMQILTSSDSMMDINRKQASPNSAVVIRPNGDVRMDCTMPFTVGNVLKNDIADIWRNLGANCWHHPMVNEYIAQLDELGIHPTHKNHHDLDMRLEIL